MGYAVKEIFYTLQGEGTRTGRAAVFCRFAGCNLWSGRNEDRETATCRFCDTDFAGMDGEGGGRYPDAASLADAIARLWPRGPDGRSREGKPYVVCTGGEPLLQLDSPLIDALHARGFEVAVETNGTVAPPAGIDWLCVSPKAGARLAVRGGDEIKLVIPQPDLTPATFDALDFRHWFVQPMDGPAREANTRLAVAWCLAHPKWRLSLQTHKITGIQ